MSSNEQEPETGEERYWRGYIGGGYAGAQTLLGIAAISATEVIPDFQYDEVIKLPLTAGGFYLIFNGLRGQFSGFRDQVGGARQRKNDTE